MTDFSAAHINPSLPRSQKTVGLMSYVELYRQRRALAKLDATQLSDIGLTQDEARAEAARSIWDAPSYWVTPQR